MGGGGVAGFLTIDYCSRTIDYCFPIIFWKLLWGRGASCVGVGQSRDWRDRSSPPSTGETLYLKFIPHDVWQSFITIKVCRDRIPALAPS